MHHTPHTVKILRDEKGDKKKDREFIGKNTILSDLFVLKCTSHRKMPLIFYIARFSLVYMRI